MEKRSMKKLSKNALKFAKNSAPVVLLTVGMILMSVEDAGAKNLGDVCMNLVSFFKKGLVAVEAFAMFASVCLIIWGLFQVIKKDKNPQIKSSSIALSLVVGVCLGALTYFVEASTGALFGEGVRRGAHFQI